MIEIKEETNFMCSNCGKVHIGNSTPSDWHTFSGHHASYGDDGYDSYEYYVACSPECYYELLSRAIEELKNYQEPEIDNFKIEFLSRLINEKNSATPYSR